MERISKVDLCGHPGIGYILSIADDAPSVRLPIFPLNPSKPARVHIAIIMFCLGPKSNHVIPISTRKKKLLVLVSFASLSSIICFYSSSSSSMFIYVSLLKQTSMYPGYRGVNHSGQPSFRRERTHKKQMIGLATRALQVDDIWIRGDGDPLPSVKRHGTVRAVLNQRLREKLNTCSKSLRALGI